MSQKILYIVWFLFPLFFFMLALWSKLEKVGGKKRQERPKDFVQQAFFIIGCILVAILIDQFFLPKFTDWVSFLGFPLAFYQVLLLPFVLMIGAKIVGPTKDVKISKVTSVSENRRR